jgi:hypothetical protein
VRALIPLIRDGWITPNSVSLLKSGSIIGRTVEGGDDLCKGIPLPGYSPF